MKHIIPVALIPLALMGDPFVFYFQKDVDKIADRAFNQRCRLKIFWTAIDLHPVLSSSTEPGARN
jgi:hypothetical protein